MIELHYDLFPNFLYHVFAHVDVAEPASVYNSEYVKNNELNIPPNILLFFKKYLAILSHFPFYQKINDIKAVLDLLDKYLLNFPNEQSLISDYELVKEELGLFVSTEYQKYKDNWNSEQIFSELKAFKEKHLDKFVHATKFFNVVTGIKFESDLDIWLLKAMPENRGKCVMFPNVKGMAIAVPGINNMSDEVYFSGVHELAHHFTDKLLLQYGHKLSTDKGSNDYIRRESLADLVADMYFKDISKTVKLKWEIQYIPEDIKEQLSSNYAKLESGIDLYHFGNYSKSFVGNKSADLAVAKDIFFVEKKNNRVYFFLPLIGRMVGVPIRYFKSLSPVKFDGVYRDHFIDAGLLVASNHKYSWQTVKGIDKVNGMVKKIRFHMTDRCNLRCEYCYLSSGEAKDVSVEVNADKAIEYLNKIYGDNLNGIEIEFHGGGEPTLMIEEIKKIAAYVDERVKKRTFRLQTNGLFSKDIIDWIVDNDITVSVSLDGDKEINDTQRTKGTGSFEKIIENVRELVSRGVKVSTVSVITEYSQDKVNRIYEFIKSLGIRAMMMNPVHSFLGRSAEHDIAAKRDVDLMYFVDEFLKIKQKSEKDNIFLVSDFLPDFYQYIPRNYQCDACKPGLGVYGNGDVCSCTRAYDLGSGFENPFVWAKVDDGVEINEKNNNALLERVTENMTDCRHCLLKWNCAGDCLLQCHELHEDMYKVHAGRCDAKVYYIVEYLKSLIKPSPLGEGAELKDEVKVALIHLPAVTPMLPPPGVNVLANYLLEKDISCEVLDLNKDLYNQHKDNWSKTFLFDRNYQNDESFRVFINKYLSQLILLLKQNKYNYIGLSCYENTFTFMRVFLGQLKASQLPVKIFLGGPDVFMELDKYKEFIKDDVVDVLILKEGEQKVLAYIKEGKVIEGVITKDNVENDFKFFKDKEVIDINDSYLYEKYLSGVNNGKFTHQVMPIAASRGCSSNCSFCSHKLLWDGYRLRTATEVVSEMQLYREKYNCNLFYFTDMLLNGSHNWLKEFVNNLNVIDEKMYWSAYMRIHPSLDEAFCAKLSAAGAVYLSFGIESNSQHVLDTVNKGTKVEDNENVIPNVAKAGIFIHASFIIGLPEEQIDDLVMTLDYVKRNIWDIDHVEIFFFENLPQASGYEFSKDYLENRAKNDKYSLKKTLYDELIVKFNKVGSGFLSSRQLYSEDAAIFKKALNEFYRRKYTGDTQSGDEEFLVIAEKMHKFKMQQIDLLNEFIERITGE